MKKKNWGIAVGTCLVGCFGGFVASCASQSVSVTFKENPVVYRVGDNVDVYDFIEAEKGVSYSFAIQLEDWEDTEPVYSRTYCVREAGEYSLTCTATKKDKTATDTLTFEVKEKAPQISIAGTETVDLNDDVDLISLPWAVASPVSDTAYDMYVELVEYYEDEDDDTAEIIDIAEGQDSFVYEREGVYKFCIYVTNAGGSSFAYYKVLCEEYIDHLPLLEDNNAAFDKATSTVTWEAVDGASSYKVKIGTKSTVVNTTTANVASLLSKKDFKYFDLVILPLNGAGEKLSKIILPEIIMTPAAYEDKVVLSKYTTVDVDTRVATLEGTGAGTGAYEYVKQMVNDYVGFYGDYGAGWYVDFEFQGNNLPNVCFFSNDLSGNMTDSEGGKGLLVMNGLTYTNGTVFLGDQVRVYGPNRLSEAYWDSGTGMLFRLKGETEYSMLTQDMLANNPDKQFKYSIGTFTDADDNLFLEMELFQKNGNGAWEYVKMANGGEYHILRALAKETVFGSGHILAYASVKGMGSPTQFQFSQPYQRAEKPIQEGFVGGSNAIINADGSYALKADNFYSDSTTPVSGRLYWSDALNTLQNGFIGLKGDYGVGTYLKIKFGATDYNGTLRADNMPNVILFTNDLNAGFTAQQGDGLLITPGISACNDFINNSRNNRMHVYGPNRIPSGDTNDYQNGGIFTNLFEYYPYFTLHGLQSISEGTFTYIVGSYLSDEGTVVLDISIYYECNGKLIQIHNRQDDTLLTTAELPGTNVILSAANKADTWSALTEFTFDVYSGKEAALPSNYPVNGYATFNEDGTVSLKEDNFYAKDFPAALNTLQNGFIGLEGEYGVGKYVQVKFGATDYNGTLRADNMPNVILFTNDLNAGFTAAHGDGYLITAGVAACNETTSVARNNKMLIHGPNRIATADGYYTDALATQEHYNYPLLTQWGLGQLTVGEFVYLVGSKLDSTDGTVLIDIALYYQVDGKTVTVHSRQVDTGKQPSELPGKKIVLSAANKYGTWDAYTKFSYEIVDGIPEQYAVQGNATFNADGTVTLANKAHVNSNDHLKAQENAYLALKGEYGVGTYVDITFSASTEANDGVATDYGNDNIPNVMFFVSDADVNGYKGSQGGSGLLLMNGVGYYAGMNKQAEQISWLRAFGPNRISTDYSAYVGGITYNDYPLLTQRGLIEDTQDTTYQYTVGTFLNADEKIVVDISLSKKSGDSWVAVYENVEMVTTLTQADVTAGNILLLAENKQLVWEATTTFGYSAPYQKR